MIRVLIVAPYAAVRVGLHTILCEADDLAVLGEVSGSEELDRLVPTMRPDVVVFDDTTDDINRLLDVLECSDIGLVMLTDNDRDYVRLANTPLTGWACLRKEADGQEIVAAIRAAASGLIVLDRTLGPLLASARPRSRAEKPADPGLLPDEPLTPREEQVLQLVALGLANKQIGARLAISLSTVKFHVASILSKLGAGSRTEAVRVGARQGLVTL